MIKKYLILLLALSLPLFADESVAINSEPVDWTQLSLAGSKLSLPGVFSVSLPDQYVWKAILAGTGPTGSPFHMWSVDVSKGPRNALLAILDVEIAKVPESERDSFLNTFITAFRRTGIEAMEKKGFRTSKFEIVPYSAGGKQCAKAISDFEKNGSHIYNITYVFPLKRLYLLGYEGNEAQEPKWFIDTMVSFTKS